MLSSALALLAKVNQPISALPRVREFTVDHLADHQRLDSRVELGQQGILALRLQGQRYDEASDFVASDPTRAATASRLRTRRSRPAYWIETRGVLELGTGDNGTLSADALVARGTGFAGDTLLSYRSVVPTTEPEALNELSFIAPLTAEAARGCSAGVQFELSGRGRVGAGLNVSAFTASGGPLQAGAGYVYEGEIALDVRVLDDRGRVRVTLRASENDSQQATIALLAPTGAARLGQGALEGMVNAEGPIELNPAVRASVSGKRSGKVLASYTLDLSTEQGRQAYGALMRLDRQSAEAALANGTASGEWMAQVHDKDERKAHLDLFGIRLLGWMVRHTDAALRMRTGSGQEVVARGKKYEHSFGNFMRGRRHILWQSLIVPPELDGLAGTYFNMRFDAQQRHIGAADVATYAVLADALGVPLATDLGLGASHRQIEATVNVFFTEAGIDRIRGSDLGAAMVAYLEQFERFHGEPKGIAALARLPPATLIRLHELAARLRHVDARTTFEPGMGFDYPTERTRVVSQYHKLTGRDLPSDGPVLQRVEAFAACFAALGDAADGDAAADFFSQMGEAHGSDYMIAIAALAQLAGPDNTVVAELRLEGDTVDIRADSVPELPSPEEALERMWQEGGIRNQVASRPGGLPPASNAGLPLQGVAVVPSGRR